jgi:hypothetical protein
MSALGDLLELLHDAAVKARPATLTVVEWSHAARSSEAFARFMAQRHSGTAYASSREPSPEESSWSTTLSFEHESRFREEADGRQAGQRFLVRDGSVWLTWDAAWGTVSSEVEEGAPSANYGFLLDPVALVGELRLEPTGTAEHAARPAILVHGIPRDGPSVGSMLLRLGAGADAFALVVDAERGALLRVEAMLHGEPFRRFDVTRIAYGPIDPSTFTVAAPPGAPAAAGWPRPQPMPLHEIAARAPFTLLVPERVPDGWRLTAMLLQGRDEPPLPTSATLSYTSPEGAYGVTLQERAAGATDAEDGWRTWRRDGELEVADEGEYVDPRHHVRLERDGTVVELSGSDPGLLAQLARSLVPAAAEPPRLP